MTHFSYKSFHEYYTNFDDTALYESSPDISAIIYDCKAFFSNEHAKKPNEARKFRYTYTKCAPKLTTLSSEHHKSFHHGIYFLLNERQSLQHDKQIFFVYPRKKYISNTPIQTRHFYGDHFSFQYIEDNQNSVNIHETEYIPRNQEESRGVTIHTYVNTKDDIPLPTRTTYPRVFSDLPEASRNLLIDIMNPQLLHGGAKKTQDGGTKKTYRRRVAPSLPLTERTVGFFQNKTIGEFCQTYNIAQIACICFDGVCSVTFQSQLPDQTALGFSFEASNTAFSETLAREELLRYIKSRQG